MIISPYHVWDHLHIRGEYLCLEKLLLDKTRIISTYVENTGLFRLQGQRTKDHLHIRGEYCQSPSLFIFTVGSSPHTWRIHDETTRAKAEEGIISTYVENTEIEEQVKPGERDHLHIRGEYTKKIPSNQHFIY